MIEAGDTVKIIKSAYVGQKYKSKVTTVTRVDLYSFCRLEIDSERRLFRMDWLQRLPTQWEKKLEAWREKYANR